MTKKLLLGIIVVLLITNVATMLLWKNDQSSDSVLDDESIDTNKPVASIGEKDISYTDWMKALKSNYGEKQLKSMVDRQVVKTLAEQNGVQVSDKVIERDVALLTTMQGVTTESKLKELEQKWIEDITYRYQLEALLAKDMTVSDEEVESYYAKYDGQYQFNKSVQLSHILVSDMETAEKVHSELEAGASFPLLAKEYSIDETTKDSGGYLGFNSVDTEFLPGNYFEIVEGLEEYSYSEPFVTTNGVALLYLHKSLPEITFSFEELKPYIRNELALQASNQNLIVDQLWDDLDIKWIYGE